MNTERETGLKPHVSALRGCSLVVKPLSSKQMMRVRFSSAPQQKSPGNPGDFLFLPAPSAAEAFFGGICQQWDGPGVSPAPTPGSAPSLVAPPPRFRRLRGSATHILQAESHSVVGNCTIRARGTKSDDKMRSRRSLKRKSERHRNVNSAAAGAGTVMGAAEAEGSRQTMRSPSTTASRLRCQHRAADHDEATR